MEGLSSYTALKNSLSSIPAKALNYSSRLILSRNLNIKQVLPSKNNHIRDYRGLAELMDFQYIDIKNFERNDDPTMKILETWETHANSTLDKLIEFLEEMERHDVIKELTPLLERNAETYLQSQNLHESPIQVPEVTSCPMNNMPPERELQVFTREDLQTGECTYYDAYVAYADEDCSFVHQLAHYLESEIGLKLFIRGRDLLAGYAEHDTNIMLIKKRCRRMLIILSPNFLRSPACEFQASFAASLAIEQRQRILIPVIIASCEIPLMLKYISKIDFTKPDIHDWVLEKLVSSLLPEDNSSMFLNKSSPKRNNTSPNLGCITSASSPLITYPPTMQHLQCSAESSTTTAVTPVSSDASVSSKDLNNPACNTTKQQNTHKKWKFPWSSQHKKQFSSTYSSNSVSSSSNATSGFHSQTGNAIENYESSTED